MCQVGRFTSHHRKRDGSARRARRRVRRRDRRRCLTTDGPGRSAIQQHRGAPSAGVAWCNEQRITRLPLLGASAAPSRRRRTTHEAIAQRHRASGCRPEGCGFESRWSRSPGTCLVALLRARGAALTSRRRCAVPATTVPAASGERRAASAQRRARSGCGQPNAGVEEFESLRPRPRRGWCKWIGTRGCGPLGAGSRPVPLMHRHVPSATMRRRIDRENRSAGRT